VLEVDVARGRISLTMKLDAQAPRRDAPRENRFEHAGRGQRSTGGNSGSQGRSPAPQGTAMASAFEKLKGLSGR
jgi:uncharacterized protein